MSSLFKLIRWANLVIIALTLYIVRWAILLPALQLADQLPLLNHFEFNLLVLATTLIAAAGYIINDILDLPIDLINKPQKVIIQKKISTAQAWWIYGILNSLALLIGLYLQNLILLLIFGVTILALAFYAVYWKHQFLIGNVVVALLCALVVVEVWVLDWQQLPSNYLFPLQILGGYTLFAFLTTLLRELIKDIEDIEGDRQQNCQTVPIVLGVNTSLFLVFGIGLGLLISLVLGLYSWQSFLSSLLLVLFVLLTILPLLAILTLLTLAEAKSQFKQLSQLIKIYMGLGLVWLSLLYSHFMDIIKIGLG